MLAAGAIQALNIIEKDPGNKLPLTSWWVG